MSLSSHPDSPHLRLARGVSVPEPAVRKFFNTHFEPLRIERELSRSIPGVRAVRVVPRGLDLGLKGATFSAAAGFALELEYDLRPEWPDWVPSNESRRINVVLGRYLEAAVTPVFPDAQTSARAEVETYDGGVVGYRVSLRAVFGALGSAPGARWASSPVQSLALEESLARFSRELPEYRLELVAGDGGVVTEEAVRRAESVGEMVRAGLEGFEDLCDLKAGACEGNLGLGRDSMPQIPSNSVPELLRSKDSKEKARGRAAVEAGADPEDDRPLDVIFLEALKARGIRVIGADDGPPVQVGWLKATQRELKAAKTYSIADAYLKGEFDPLKAPFIVSQDDHILDGHHRWAGLVAVDPRVEVRVVRVGLPMRKLLAVAFELPGVFRVDLQDRPVGAPWTRTASSSTRVAVRFFYGLR